MVSSALSEFLTRLGAYSALEFMTDGQRSYTYGDLLAECRDFQPHIDAAAIGRGTVVGMLADYSLSSVGALLALLSKQAVVALIPPGGQGDHFTAARAEWALSIADGEPPRWRRLPPQPDHELLARLRNEGDAGLVIFTSGSTGRPKAALQSMERFLWKFRKQGRRFRTLAFMSFDHIGGMDTLFHTLAAGGTLVVTRDRSPGAICGLIERARIEVLPAAPSFLRLLCMSTAIDERDLSSLKVITYGAEQMDPDTLARLNARFPSVEISQKYGTTELGAPRSVSRGKDSLWLKITGSAVETRVVNGVLHVRCPGLMLGYLNAPSPIDGDGWYCTGDLVDVEREGASEWLRFRGRAANIINVGGEKVAPVAVEQVILELPFVQEAVVSGEPHVLMGHVVTARVALKPDTDPQEARRTIRRHCRSRLPAYMVPVKIETVARRLTTARQKAMRMANYDEPQQTGSALPER